MTIKNVLNNAFKWVKNKIYKYSDCEILSRSIIFCTLGGYFASWYAQNKGINKNDSYTKDEKSLMRAQEGTETLINCALYWFVTNSVDKWIDKKVTSGLWTTENIHKFIGDKSVKNVADTLKNRPELLEEFKNFKGNAKICGTAAGLTISAILATIAKNYFAPKVVLFFNNRNKEKNDLNNTDKPNTQNKHNNEIRKEYNLNPNMLTTPYAFSDYKSRAASMRI